MCGKVVVIMQGDGRRNTSGNELVKLESGYFFFK